jgi:nucleotide-binding universal stress UspA family protein
MQKMLSRSQLVLKNVLFATDFGAAASRALPFAAALAGRYGAQFHAAHVIPQDAYAYASPESVEQIFNEARDFAKYTLNQTVAPLQQRGLPCDIAISDGEITEQIQDLVDQYKADLLVVGTSSRGGVGKFLLGSVAEELIRDSRCAVLTVGPQVVTLASEGIHQIVCATDFSPWAERAAEMAVSIASQYDAHLTFIHVVEHASKDFRNFSLQVLEKRTRDAIPAEAELLHQPQTLVEIGNVAARILRVTSDLAADLIVMGVRGTGAFAQTASRFGSTAHRVISEARCPVLTVTDANHAGGY